MENRKFLLAAVACGLAVLLIVAGGVIYLNMPQSPNPSGIPQQADNSQSNPQNITQTVADSQQSYQDVPEAAYHSLFGQTPIKVDRNIFYYTPVSPYLAAIIGLENGGWNQTSLQSMTVYVSLIYYEFTPNSTIRVSSNGNFTIEGSQTSYIRLNGGSVNDWTPSIHSGSTLQNGTTHRYVWDVVVLESDSQGTAMPPPGLYCVDANTAELIPTGPLY